MTAEILSRLADLATVFALLGAIAALAGALATAQFVHRAAPLQASLPAISLLKPLCGNEPLLYEALETFFRLDYPRFQIVFGVQNPTDPALAVVQSLVRRWPGADVAIVTNAAIHGANRKVSNLINMLPAARHDVLVFADSDLHVPPFYLRHVASTLARPGVGLVTALSTGRTAGRGVAALLGCMQISYGFLPAVLLSRWLGRQDCLGTTMALHRRTLRLAGGLGALVNHLADDQVLGRRVRALGLSVTLAPIIPSTTVAETTLGALWTHELRWARTMAALEPSLCLLASLQYALVWAALAVTLSGGRPRMAALFGVIWAARAAALLVCAQVLPQGPRSRQGAARAACLLPVRDMLSAAVAVASFCGNRVLWRGHVLHADKGVGADQAAQDATARVGSMIAIQEKGPYWRKIRRLAGRTV